MIKQTCRKCLFEDNCHYDNRPPCCEYYYPANDENEISDEYIEDRRREFYKEWFAYIREEYE